MWNILSWCKLEFTPVPDVLVWFYLFSIFYLGFIVWYKLSSLSVSVYICLYFLILLLYHGHNLTWLICCILYGPQEESTTARTNSSINKLTKLSWNPPPKKQQLWRGGGICWNRMRDVHIRHCWMSKTGAGSLDGNMRSAAKIHKNSQSGNDTSALFHCKSSLAPMHAHTHTLTYISMETDKRIAGVQKKKKKKKRRLTKRAQEIGRSARNKFMGKEKSRKIWGSGEAQK